MCDGTAVRKRFVKIHGNQARAHSDEASALTRSNLRGDFNAWGARFANRLVTCRRTGSRCGPTILQRCGLCLRPCAMRRARGRRPSGWRWSLSLRSTAAVAPRAAASPWPPPAASAPAPWPRSRARPASAPGPCRPAGCSSTSAPWRSSGSSRMPRSAGRSPPRPPTATPTAGSSPQPPRPPALLLARLVPRPLDAAVWVLCAAALPLVAYALQQRAHGVFFQTSPRLQGVLGYPNALGAYAALTAPGALWLASTPVASAARRAARRCRCSCSRSVSRPRAADCWPRSSAAASGWRSAIGARRQAPRCSSCSP